MLLDHSWREMPSRCILNLNASVDILVTRSIGVMVLLLLRIFCFVLNLPNDHQEVVCLIGHDL